MSITVIRKIVSGGQTGADRAGLDWAISRGVPHGGWCPLGRKSEDGRIHEKYLLMEAQSGNYKERTELNVRDSDGTVILTGRPALHGGSLLTARMAERHGRAWLHLNLSEGVEKAGATLRKFASSEGVGILNVAGNRESICTGITDFVWQTLDAAFATDQSALWDTRTL